MTARHALPCSRAAGSRSNAGHREQSSGYPFRTNSQPTQLRILPFAPKEIAGESALRQASELQQSCMHVCERGRLTRTIPQRRNSAPRRFQQAWAVPRPMTKISSGDLDGDPATSGLEALSRPRASSVPVPGKAPQTASSQPERAHTIARNSSTASRTWDVFWEAPFGLRFLANRTAHARGKHIAPLVCDSVGRYEHSLPCTCLTACFRAYPRKEGHGRSV